MASTKQQQHSAAATIPTIIIFWLDLDGLVSIQIPFEKNIIK